MMKAAFLYSAVFSKGSGLENTEKEASALCSIYG